MGGLSTNVKETQMPEGDIETFHQDYRWHNKVEGGHGVEIPPATSQDTKEDALRVGREMVRQAKVEHIIKNMDGKIAERNSYGNDPRDIKG